MTNAMVNRRLAPRFPLVLSAEVVEKQSGARLHARTSDVSLSGCYVDTLNPVPRGSKVCVRLTRRREVFEVMAEVMYESPRMGMGLQFEAPLPPAQLAILERWLADADRKP